jgi:hypothetical protein
MGEVARMTKGVTGTIDSKNGFQYALIGFKLDP